MDNINGIPFLWDQEENQLFGQLNPLLGVNNSNQNSINTNTNVGFDEISYEKKYGLTNKCKPCEEKFYNGPINIKNLINDIRLENNNTSFFFGYKKYLENLNVFKSPFHQFEASPFESNTLESALGIKPRSNDIKVSVPFVYLDKNTLKEKHAELIVLLNERECYINNSDCGYKINFNFLENKLECHLEFIYSDSLQFRNFNNNTVSINDYSLPNKYKGVIIKANNLDDFIALLKEIGKTGIIKEIGKKLGTLLTQTTEVEKLVFLYDFLPSDQSILKGNITLETINQHIELLSSYDDKGFFSFLKDESGTLLKAFSLLTIFQEGLYNFILDDAYLKRIYNNLDGESIWNEEKINNKVFFATLLYAICVKTKQVFKPKEIFYYGNEFDVEYKIDSHIFRKNDEKDDEFFLKQSKVIPFLGIEMLFPLTEEIERDKGDMYKPLEMVYLVQYQDEVKTTQIVPAIFVKALAEQKEWIEVDREIRIGFDILALIAGIVALGTTANPGLLALAVADIALATGDIAIQSIVGELQKTKEGQAFLETWENIYLVGGVATAIISAPQLVQSFYKLGNSVIKNASKLNNSVLLKGIREFYLKAYIDINSANFVGNTVKIIEPKVLFLSSQYNKMAEAMTESGVLFVSGKKEGELLEYYAAIYKGEVIEEFTTVSKNKFAARYWRLNTKELAELLEQLYKNGGVPFLKGYSKNKILNIPKGQRPEPVVYLPKEYINNHLKIFEDDKIVSRIVLKKSFDNYGLGKPDKWKSEFISSKLDIDKLLKEANGKINIISENLGIPVSQIKGGGLIRVDFKLSKYNKVNIPSGNEYGTNIQWVPGGKLPTGKIEGIISLEGLIEGRDYVISTIKIK